MLFNPKGFLAPLILWSKLFLQKRLFSGLDWDQILNAELEQEVEEWFSELKELKDLQIARCLQKSDEFNYMKIRVFADASSKAYGAVTFLQGVHIET